MDINKISEEKREEVYNLVMQQKKANVSWLAKVTDLTEDDIKAIAWDYGLVVENEQVMLTPKIS